MAQFVAGLYAYLRANVLDAMSFCSFGALYVLLARFYGLELRGVLPAGGATTVIEGFVLLSFAFISIALMFADMPTNLASVWTLGLRTLGFCLVGIPFLWAAAVGSSMVADIGGWFLVASALVAYYLGMAITVNSTWGRTVLPIWGTP